jgi:hypothetical protein
MLKQFLCFTTKIKFIYRYIVLNIVYIIKYFKNNVRRVHRNFTRRKKNIIYERNTVCTTFGHRKSVYCDFIASGLASKFVEDYIKDNIFSKYSNTLELHQWYL